MAKAKNLSENFIHLGLGATAISQPPFTGMEWYGDYGARYSSDGAEGRLVSLYTFTESWDVWEMHPKGAEVVVCTAGTITLIQETKEPKQDIQEQDIQGHDIQETRITLCAGDYAINPPGVWHTADVEGQATALFITAGEGTQHRPR